MCRQTAAFLKIIMAISLLSGAATVYPQWFSLDVTLARQGEWWRLLSGHFVHLSWQHYLFDMLAVAIALRLCIKLGISHVEMAGMALLSGAAVSLLVMTLQPVDIYGGSSGITFGLFAGIALKMAGGAARLSGALLLVAAVVKLGIDSSGAVISAIPPVWQAHAAGIASGILMGLVRIVQKHGCFASGKHRTVSR